MNGVDPASRGDDRGSIVKEWSPKSNNGKFSKGGDPLPFDPSLYTGFQIEGEYALTDNFTLSVQYEKNWSLEKSMGEFFMSPVDEQFVEKVLGKFESDSSRGIVIPSSHIPGLDQLENMSAEELASYEAQIRKDVFSPSSNPTNKLWKILG